MGSRFDGKRKVLPCVLMDVNTQFDFLDPRGSCPVANRNALVPALRRTVAWAKRNQIPVISAIDCHRRDEVRNSRLPMHCLDGTRGQEKMGFTLFGSYVRVEGDNTLSVPIDLFRRHQQVIFRKRTSDFFLNPRADRFISQLPAAEYIVVGLGIEGAVKAITLGLIGRHKRTTVVVDACGFFDHSDAELALRLLEAKGAQLITVDELLARKLPRPIRYPRRGDGLISLRNGLYASVTQPSNGNGNGHAHKPNGQALEGRIHPGLRAPASKPRVEHREAE